MKKDTRNILIAVAVTAAVFAAAYSALIVYSGSFSPFYTVESGSMRHSGDSQIGVIDAGDMMLVRDPSVKTVVSYIEGRETEYMMFGDCGDVIVYERPGRTPVIHRVILFIEYNGNGTWNAPALAAYTGAWSCTGGTDAGSLSGVLRFDGLGWNGASFDVDLNALRTDVPSGYITKGDANPGADQSAANISLNMLVGKDRVIAVAANEVPWLGCIKLLFTDSEGSIPPNSIVCLVLFFTAVTALIAASCILYDRLKKR